MANSLRIYSKRVLATPLFAHSKLGVSYSGRRVPNAGHFQLSLVPPPASRASSYFSLPTNRRYSTNTNTEQKDITNESTSNLINDDQKGVGESETMDFQAETRKLLDIVARSLYSEREVFVRELVSNSSDAIEKLRYLQVQGSQVSNPDLPLEVHITTDDEKRTISIQDTGVGLTKEELVSNIGTIAKSGTKSFFEQFDPSKDAVDNKNIIGQFGVGFYSTFIVADTVDLYTKSYREDSPALKWSSDGQGTYTITKAEGVSRGTKVVVNLKGEHYEFAKEATVKEVVKKYSNFVGVPVYLNGKICNEVEALWMKDIREVTEQEHDSFYKFLANAYDSPRYHLHYKADAPLNIRALFYVPEYKPTLFDMSRETDVSVSLYCRKVMIVANASHILPKWLRFLKGVVDSEDIPLNLSRELLQESGLIQKLRWVLTNRILKFFSEHARKDPEKFLEFYEDFGLFIREGIVTTTDQEQREEISSLLRFESSTLNPGEKTGVADYVQRMSDDSKHIYYLSAPNRQLAEGSPYLEAMRKENNEVLFCFEPYDELVLMNLGQFKQKTLKSIENAVAEGKRDAFYEPKDESSLKGEETGELLQWLQGELGQKVAKVKVTNRLDSYPCIITVAEMGAARHFLRTTLADKSDEEKIQALQPTLEVNPGHPIIKKLHSLRNTDAKFAKLLAHQLFDNGMIAAGLLDDPRKMLIRMNVLLEKALEKH